MSIATSSATIGIDATYSLGKNLSGVGIYSRELLFGLAQTQPAQPFQFYYRPNRFFRSFSGPLPGNAHRRVLLGMPQAAPNCDLFHSLNQRVDAPAKRTVSTFHDLFVISGNYSSPEFRARFIDQARRAAEHSNAVIAVSRFTALQVEQLLNVEPARIHVIPHGVHLPSAKQHPKENIVLSAGVIQKRKNIGRLVQAFEKMPKGWRLFLAGATEGFGAAEELRTVEHSPRRADIELLGHISRAQLDTLYARARIFAFPSLDEGFGMPVLEAMAHGVPVITSNTSAMPEVAGTAAWLIDPTNVDQLADALHQLAEDEALRAGLSERGIARARLFPWRNAVEQTWSLYEKLLGT